MFDAIQATYALANVFGRPESKGVANEYDYIDPIQLQVSTYEDDDLDLWNNDDDWWVNGPAFDAIDDNKQSTVLPTANLGLTGSGGPEALAYNIAVDKAAESKKQGKAPIVTGWKSKYSNGKIPDEALTTIGGGHALRKDAALAYRAMRRAAAKDGVEWGITDSYRDYDTQVRLAQEKGLYSQGGLAAVPGTSEHGWGLATDLDLGPEALAWLKENASDYGYHTIDREPWHWEYRGGYKPAYAAPKKPSRTQRKRSRADIVSQAPAMLVSDDPKLMGTMVMIDALSPSLKTATPSDGFAQSGMRSGHINHKALTPQLKKIFEQAAARTGVSVRLLEIMGDVESDFSPTVVSSAGAVGVMQLMPLHWQGKFDPRDPKKNIMYGAGYIAGLIREHGLREGLARYNGGNSPPSSSYEYADDIIERLRG